MKIGKKTNGNTCFSHSKKNKKEQNIPGNRKELKRGMKGGKKGEKNLQSKMLLFAADFETT
jgi:hypothetical protein